MQRKHCGRLIYRIHIIEVKTTGEACRLDASVHLLLPQMLQNRSHGPKLPGPKWSFPPDANTLTLTRQD